VGFVPLSWWGSVRQRGSGGRARASGADGAPAVLKLQQASEDNAGAALDQVPRAVLALRDPAERQLVRTRASAVAELIGEPGDRLLHWDLHYDNVLAGQREPWSSPAVKIATMADGWVRWGWCPAAGMVVTVA
jgi:acetylornithine deacetylase/succinyl-diaminopimelate desuccinylase-like protein